MRILYPLPRLLMSKTIIVGSKPQNYKIQKIMESIDHCQHTSITAYKPAFWLEEKWQLLQEL